MWGDQITQTYTFLPQISLAGSLRATVRNCLVFAHRSSWGRIVWYHRPKFAFSPCNKFTLLATPHSSRLAWHGLTKVAIRQKLNLHLELLIWVLCFWLAPTQPPYGSPLSTVVFWELRHWHCLATWLRLFLESDGRVSISGESDEVMQHFCLLRHRTNLSSPFCQLGRQQCLICALFVEAFCQVWIICQCASVVNSLVFLKWQLFRQYLTPSSVIT